MGRVHIRKLTYGIGEATTAVNVGVILCNNVLNVHLSLNESMHINIHMYVILFISLSKNLEHCRSTLSDNCNYY